MDIRVNEIVESNYDDPSLALLFSQLKSKTLQAAKGTSEISGRTEFNFVLQIARVFCRMGKPFPFRLLKKNLNSCRMPCLGFGPRSVMVVRATIHDYQTTT